MKEERRGIPRDRAATAAEHAQAEALKARIEGFAVVPMFIDGLSEPAVEDD